MRLYQKREGMEVACHPMIRGSPHRGGGIYMYVSCGAAEERQAAAAAAMNNSGSPSHTSSSPQSTPGSKS